MNEVPAIQAILSDHQQIVITTHTHPDADALGSSLGLKHFLDQLGHSVQVVTPTDYPDFLKWMHGNEEVIIFDPENSAPSETCIQNADIIFCLDFSDLKRIENLAPLVEKSSAKKVIIDHHRDPQDFYHYMVHSTDAAATAELVFDIIVEMKGENAITKEIAACLYAGLMTDTGSFKHSNVNAKVLMTAAKLAEHGANANRIAKLIYDNNTADRLRFLGYALWELMKIDINAGIGYFAISAKDYARFNLQSGDTEGLVNYALSIKGIKVAALFKEQNDLVKISFRSVDDIAVNTFAQNYFDGGGHLNAAGGRSSEGLQSTVERFKNLVNEGKLI